MKYKCLSWCVMFFVTMAQMIPSTSTAFSYYEPDCPAELLE